PFAHNNLGTLLARAGDYDAAAAHFVEAVRINPRYALALANLANCYLRKGQEYEAFRVFRDALRLMPDEDPKRPIIQEVVDQLAAAGAGDAPTP
ncbi:MAG: tetratricopeptide repeat protein, partial [Candidatus Hydrogenedentes bacterium]|nr:tetratricopeptide repeat protein [Candidatus Hydrogenedentota bacterium]